jgi:4-hydroxy-2-oxoglutarate aldolase
MSANGANGSSRRPLKAGVYVPTVAFFKEPNEELDVATVEKHAVLLAQAGIAGIVAQGSNGEAVHLDREERKVITAATRRALDANGFQSMPLIVGVGAQSTRETIIFSQDAAQAGGDYVIVLPPSYYKSLVSNAALLDYFRDVATASPVPVLIYNFPAAANGIDLTSDDIIALSQHPNIVGVKLTCGNTGKLARIAAGVKPGFFTFGGSADFTLQTLIAGGQGVIAGVANVIPRACAHVQELYEKGQVQEAQKAQAIVARADWVTIQGGFVSVKAALQTYSGYGGLPRKPTVLPSEAGITSIKDGFSESMALEKSLAKN